MKIQECIEAAKNLPIGDLLKYGLKDFETDHWLALTLVISESDHELDLVLQEVERGDAKIDHSYGTVNLGIRELLSEKWELAEFETGTIKE